MSDTAMFPFTDEHKMIRDTARDFAQKELAPIAAEFDESGEFPMATIQKMGQMGFMGIEVPEEYGGAGMDTLSYVLALEEISKVDASHGVIMSVNNSLYCHGILKFGTEEQKKKFLPSFTESAKLAAFALTEPNAGSDASAVATRATRVGNDYVLEGTKCFITHGGIADLYVIFASTDRSKGLKGLSAFIVPGDTPGLKMGKKEDKMGDRASHIGEVIIEEQGAVYKGNKNKKEIYLTFDNGYENGYTEQILDVLKKEKVPAAFFVTGHYLESAPELVERMVYEGHIIGNHSWHHPDMTQISDEKIKKELKLNCARKSLRLQKS